MVVFDTDAGNAALRLGRSPRRRGCGTTARSPLRATGPLLMLDPERHVPQPRDHARRRRPAAALHRRAGRGAQRRPDLRRGAHRQLRCAATPTWRPGCCARTCSRRPATSRLEPLSDDVAILAIRRTDVASDDDGRRHGRARSRTARRSPRLTERALAATSPGRRQAQGPEQAVRARPAGAAARRRLVRRGRPAGQQPGRRPAGRRRV